MSSRLPRCFLFMAAVAWLSPTVVAEQTRDEPLRATLDSGLEIVILPRALQPPLVSVQLWYDVGAAHDPTNQAGAAAVSRALLNARSQARQQVAAKGGVWLSQTLRDATLFAATAPAEAAPSLISMLGAIPKSVDQPVSSDELAAARASLAEQTPMTAAFVPGVPDAHWRSTLWRSLFQEHPYGRTPTDISHNADITLTSANEHLQRWFAPEAATLVIAGAVDPKPTLTAARRAFGGLSWRQAPRPVQVDLPPAAHLSPKRVPAPTNTRSLLIAWRIPPLDYFENDAACVLMQHLAHTLTDADWTISGGRLAGVITLRYTLSDNRPLHVERQLTRLDAVLRELSATPLTAQQLITARNQELRRRRRLHADFTSHALSLGFHEVVLRGADGLERGRRRVSSASVFDLQAAAARLSAAHRAVLVLQPSAPDNPRSEDRANTDAKQQPRDPQLALAHPEALLYALAASPNAAPPGVNPAAIRRGVTTAQLRFAAIAQPGADAWLLLTLDGPPESRDAARRIATEGLPNWPSDTLNELLKLHGDDLSILVGERSVWVAASGRAERFDHLLELVENARVAITVDVPRAEVSALLCVLSPHEVLEGRFASMPE